MRSLPPPDSSIKISRTRRNLVTIVVLPGLATLMLVSSAAAGSTSSAAIRIISRDDNKAQIDGYNPSVSRDGTMVTFSSAVTAVGGDLNGTTDAFLRDRPAGTLSVISSSSTGEIGDRGGVAGDISADGTTALVSSSSTNLVPNDTNSGSCDPAARGEDCYYDVFVKNLVTQQITRVSVSSSGAEADDSSGSEDISRSGRYVVFSSHATNLVRGDTNNHSDIFWHDTVSGKTRRVNVHSRGRQANSPSHYATISGNGNLVAFHSDATNLVPDDDNEATDVFVHNMETGRTRLVSVNSNGRQGNGWSVYGTISANGRSVAFASGATNLSRPDTNKRRSDVFVRDRRSGETSLVSVGTSEEQSPKGAGIHGISASGRFMLFISTNLPMQDMPSDGISHIYRRDRELDSTMLIDSNAAGEPSNESIADWSTLSANGGYVAFSSDATNLVDDDTNPGRDIFLKGPLP
ncbi:MAG: hypothetical protein M3280_04885 [Actinomycetota bacterium]|nr:hypothetical protein [Actinomycetota bacterium]